MTEEESEEKAGKEPGEIGSVTVERAGEARESLPVLLIFREVEQMGSTPASSWRASLVKEVTAPSGNVAVIRKITQRDYFPKGLLALGFAGSLDESGDAIREFLREDPLKAFELEEMILTKGVVSPRIVVVDAGEDELLLADIGQEDRDFLSAAILEWSGISRAAQAAAANFPDGERPAPGGPGDVLREGAVRAAGPDG